MPTHFRFRSRLAGVVAAGACVLAPALANAAPCPTDLPNPLYGAGGSAVTATLGAVATALAKLPDAERITLFYWDPGACLGYQAFAEKDTGSGLATRPAYFKYWNANGVLTQCEATGNEELSFAHMGNTPALCPANRPLPAGFGRFAGPIQTINFITHPRSEFNSISAEAIYYVFGFGPGAQGRAVTPWTKPEAVFGRATNSFVHQIIASYFKVPPTGFKVPQPNVLSTNPQTVQAVFAWGEANDPNEPLGYVSGSAADLGEGAGQVKTLAVQATGQTCGYLPDSSRARKDKANVRSGQYPLFTPGNFYAKVDAQGRITNDRARRLIGWFDGTVAPPAGLDILKITIDSGDIPLCAMRVNRSNGDLTPIVSFAPPNPCNGFFEFTATGSTSLKACTDNAECNTATGEQCRFGYCEAY
jgi:hypothetical protein